MKVRDIMTDPAVVVSSDSSIEETAKVMRQHNIGSVPVVDNNESLVGIVTDRDIVIRNMARGLDPRDHTVDEIMTTDVVSVTPETEIDEAAYIMASDKVRRLPVVDEQRVVGMLAIGDLAVCEDFTFEVSDALSEISEGCHKKRPSGEFRH